MSTEPIIRPAAAADAHDIADVHVAAWRSAYANLLPAGYLARMSVPRAAGQFRAAIAAGHATLVAEVEGAVVGYASLGRTRTPGLADGEVETLYVLDDHRERGLGRALLHAAAAHLEQAGCASLFLWVLAENPARWFYERMGGRPVQRAPTSVAGHPLVQTAYLWNPISILTAPAHRSRA